MQASFSSLLSLVVRGGGRGRGGGGGRMGAIISITRYLPCHQCLLCVYLADHQTSPGCNSKVLHTTISFVNRSLQTDVVCCSLLGVHTPHLLEAPKPLALSSALPLPYQHSLFCGQLLHAEQKYATWLELWIFILKSTNNLLTQQVLE